MDDDRNGERDFRRSQQFRSREMYEGKKVPYQYGDCQVDSVQHVHYDAGEYCSGGVDKNYCQSMVLKQPNWGPEQGTVHAFDQDGDRRDQDVRL